ncbi:MAG TPA: DUF1553 domain-containing protein [Pirellulales bacterium]
MFRHARQLLAAIVLLAAAAPAIGAARIEYNRDIRPILSDKCFRCHGPDGAHRQADLRLDRREDAVHDTGACRPIAPGKPEQSEVYRRITASDADERMPPADSGSVLSAREIELLRQWIAAGAEYQPHWSLVAPRATQPPPVKQATQQSAWARNEIDRFILAELEAHGLHPSPEADRPTLLRRVSLDLTGLPPTAAELDRFLADASPGAYEREVDRLLASPRYGERLALDWLDSARYADTNGYYTDLPRQAWPWRDWLIHAFNANMPLDRFTIEQLAGDLLPGATTDQRVATGFNRNHMTNNESGIIDEEFRISYVVDRVDTTSNVWLGLSIGCARCHDHKYDPITQREYYQLLAFFNNVPEKGLVKDPVNPPPVLSLPNARQQREIDEATTRRQACEQRLQALEPELKRALGQWEPSALAELRPMPTAGQQSHLALDGDAKDSGPHGKETQPIGSLAFVPGVRERGARFDATQYVELDGTLPLEASRPFSLALWIKPDVAPQGCVVSKMSSTAEARGFEIMWYKSRPRVNLVHAWGRSSIGVVSKQAFSTGHWRHLAISYDGSGRAAGVTMFIDGRSQPTVIERDNLAGSIATDEPWRLAWKGSGVGFEGTLDELRLYDRPLTAAEVEALYWREALEGGLRLPAKDRSRLQTEQLRAFYIEHHGSAELQQLSRQRVALREHEADLRAQVVSTPVMEEMRQPRATHVLARGQYDQPGEQVKPGVPKALGVLPAGAPRNRLGLARWLVDPANPLTARVLANRYWQLVYGEGIVRTANDFGLQGELPTHPKLLDWLAVRLVRSDWDLKAFIKLLVTSATYRQASKLSAELLERDPDNRLLTRGPRYRLSPEVLRDQALAAGGLLVERIGGPSVKPYQPAGLWKAVSYNGEQSYEQDHGAALYRRSMYTFWKRQAPPPAMLAFDAPTREICTIRRARTNTPLQALVLLNDVTYVEAARALGGRMLKARPDVNGRIAFGFRAATGRLPHEREVATLASYFHEQLAAYRREPDKARALLRAGESPVDHSADAGELAAWTMMAGVLLNLDETVTQH